MKKIYLISLLLVLFACGQVLAEVVTKRPITKRPVQTQYRTNSGEQSTTQTKTSTPIQNQTQTKRVSTGGSKLADSVTMCKPYSETLNSNVSGINFTFNIKIAGWVNDKCRIDFIAKSTGINEMFQSLYGFSASDAQISTFEPKVKCEFTKQQLLSVGDSILQEEERNRGAKNNMLKNPNEIDISGLANLSGSDIGLMNVILNERACTIQNTSNSNAMFESLFGM